MKIRNTAVESFLKSGAFGVVLCLVWGSFSVRQGLALLENFKLTEFLWLIYNVTISLLFLIRARPSVVSMNVSHWVVALITSFSGFLFFRQGVNSGPILSLAAESLIVGAILLGILTSSTLGRSYDFLPALRRVKTGCVYGIVRHPMYLSSIVIKLGYVLKNPSIYNACLLVVITVLYDKRAKYEEAIMSHSASYVSYLRRVKYRLVPWVY
jgi:protein-S-isoprenylcysteine O-methyltransferase Ste14